MYALIRCDRRFESTCKEGPGESVLWSFCLRTYDSRADSKSDVYLSVRGKYGTDGKLAEQVGFLHELGICP